MTQHNHQPCPCGDSSDAYSYNTEKGTGYCHSCAKGFSLNKSKETMNRYEYVEEYTEHRGLKPASLKYYDVKDTYDSQTGNLVGHSYKYGAGWKTRVFPKSFVTTQGLKTDTLFGMDKFNAGGYECLITEGEIDAISAWQMLNSKIPCVSLPSASPSSKLWQNEEVINWLGSFERIYCSFDADGKSDYIIGKLAMIFPNRVYQLQHTKYKDTNEFLLNGATEVYRNTKHNARKFVPPNMWNTADDFINILTEEGRGTVISTGIQSFDEVMGGLYSGFFYVFQAPAGVGKTELFRFIEWNILDQQKVPIAVMHMEDPKRRVLTGLASYALQLNTNRPELLTEEVNEEIRGVIKMIGDEGNLWLFEMGEADDPKDILTRIRYMAVGLGIKYIFFEPIQDLAMNRQDGSTVEQFLTWLSTKLAWLARELDICIITVAHENDDGLIRDCRMIYSRAGVVVHLKRDKNAEDPEQRNITDVFTTKNRPTAYTGPIGQLMFDPETFTLREVIL